MNTTRPTRASVAAWLGPLCAVSDTVTLFSSKKAPATVSRPQQHARCPDQQQRLATEPVHPEHGDEGGHHVDAPDGPQGGQALAGGIVEAGGGEDGVGVVDDGVDAGQLLEHGQHAGHHEGPAPLLGEDLAPAGLGRRS